MNQPYSRKYKLLKYKIDLAAKSFLVAFFMTFCFALSSDLFDKPLISVVSAAPSETSPVAGLDKEGEFTFSTFKNYARQIFGSRWKLAVAVSECECNHTRKEYPFCINSWGENGRGEHSVGAWQINLAKEGGKGAWVHAGKIPGQTIGEKEVWLKDYRNNTMMAYVISKGGTDFSPWTGYTSGCYLTKMKGL